MPIHFLFLGAEKSTTENVQLVLGHATDMSHLIPWGGGLSQKLTVDHLVNQFFNFF
jgi:hypothetical protein